MKKNITVAVVLMLAAGCTTQPREDVPPLDPTRKVSLQDCSEAYVDDGGNLKCRFVTEEERRAKAEEEARLARLKKEAEERAERERLERERLERLAREEAERKRREEEEARLAAERAERERLERERREREEAERRARREAAERECRRLEQVSSEGRALLERFVTTYGSEEEFKEIAPPIRAFLDKPREQKPCPPPE